MIETRIEQQPLNQIYLAFQIAVQSSSPPKTKTNTEKKTLS